MDGVAAGTVAGVFLLLPFLLRGAGGGDVKMLFAAGIFAGWSRVLFLLWFMSLAGLVLAISMLALKQAEGARLKHYARCAVDWRYDRKAGATSLPSRDSARCACLRRRDQCWIDAGLVDKTMNLGNAIDSEARRFSPGADTLAPRGVPPMPRRAKTPAIVRPIRFGDAGIRHCLSAGAGAVFLPASSFRKSGLRGWWFITGLFARPAPRWCARPPNMAELRCGLPPMSRTSAAILGLRIRGSKFRLGGGAAQVERHGNPHLHVFADYAHRGPDHRLGHESVGRNSPGPRQARPAATPTACNIRPFN